MCIPRHKRMPPLKHQACTHTHTHPNRSRAYPSALSLALVLPAHTGTRCLDARGARQTYANGARLSVRHVPEKSDFDLQSGNFQRMTDTLSDCARGLKLRTPTTTTMRSAIVRRARVGRDGRADGMGLCNQFVRTVCGKLKTRQFGDVIVGVFLFKTCSKTA